jgi:hypothetical protein
MENPPAQQIKTTLLAIWNPGAAGSTLGVEDERLITLPEANRLSLVQVNKIACALLLEKWLVVKHLCQSLSALDAQLCTLRGAVLALAVFSAQEDGKYQEYWQRVASDFCRHALTGMGFAPDGMAWRGAQAILERCPDLIARAESPVDLITARLAELTDGEYRGAALAGSALLVGALLMMDFREVRDLAHEQLALAIAFASGDSIAYRDGYVKFSD